MPAMEHTEMPMENMQLSIRKDVYVQWRQVGQEQGLQSDTQIASFLLQQFQCLKDTKPTQAYLCIFCNALLPSACTQCGSLAEQSDGTLTQLHVIKEDHNVHDNTSTQNQGECEQEIHDTQTRSDSLRSKAKRRVMKRKRRSYVCKECGSSFSQPGRLSQHQRNFHPAGGIDRRAALDSEDKPSSDGEEAAEEQVEEDQEEDADIQLSVMLNTEGEPALKQYKSRKSRTVPPQITKFLCQVCGGIYASKGSLKFHMRLHDGIKPYKCPDCSRAFNYSSHLTRHRRVHSGERPYLCTQCGATFTQKNDLNQHMHRHSGVKPFMCSHCGKWCSTAGDLRIHMVSHSDKRPFKCSECDLSFARESSRVKHMRTHTGEKPFKCKDCGVAYSDSSTLRRHRQRKHEEGLSRKTLHFCKL